MTHRKPSTDVVDGIVQYLIEKFHNEQYTPLFRRAGWYVEQPVIMRIVEASFAGGISNPLAYFITSIKRELRKLGK
jgi:hypothetical protein